MTSIKTLAVVAALGLGATPALAQSQLAASAGLTPGEAANLSLEEIAVAKFNRDLSGADEQRIVVPGASGDTAQLAAAGGLSPDAAAGLSLSQVAAAKFSRDSDNAHRIVPRGNVTATTRSVGQPDRAQLISSAGLSADAARGLSLTDIAAAKFARDTYN